MDKYLRKAFQFFLENQPCYIVGHHAECALALAKAERNAKSLGMFATWEHDDIGLRELREEGFDSEVCLICLIYDAMGNCCGSLSGIDDNSAEYRRVIEANLFLESIQDMERVGL
jgi:hypothetical protein